MKNLKLISKLQPSDMVSLVLMSKPGEQLDYYIIARSINYSIVASGVCDGSVPSSPCTFNILLSSLYPLIEKGYNFRISYVNELLEFISADDNMTLRPLCVQFDDPELEPIVAKFIRLHTALGSDERITEDLAKAEAALTEAQQHYDALSKMKLEGAITSSNPFGDVTDLNPSEALTKVIEDKKEQVARLKQESKKVQSINLKGFKAIALAASRTHEMLNFCDSYAVLALKSTYVLQRGACPAMSVQGPLLNQLFNYGDGDAFFWFENGLVFSTSSSTGERTAVFMEKYLPNTAVDSSIVTRGTTKEKYTIKTKGVLAVTQLMKSKFPQITFDMGEGRIILENDKGERLVTKMEIEEAASAELRKAIRGEGSPEAVRMTSLNIPVEVQSLLSLFRDKMVVYIKDRKVVFQSEDLYLVFGR